MIGTVMGSCEDDGVGEVGAGATACVRAEKRARLEGRVGKKLWTKRSCKLWLV